MLVTSSMRTKELFLFLTYVKPFKVIKTMKELFKTLGFVALIAVVVLAVVLSTGKYVLKPSTPSSADTAFVAKVVKSMQEPTSWDSYEAFDSYLCKKADEYYNDSVVYELPSDILQNVVSVLVKKNPGTSFTKKDIVREYESNKSVYDNLPTKKDEPVENIQFTDSVKQEYKDTVIGGVPVKLLKETHIKH